MKKFIFFSLQAIFLILFVHNATAYNSMVWDKMGEEDTTYQVMCSVNPNTIEAVIWEGEMTYSLSLKYILNKMGNQDCWCSVRAHNPFCSNLYVDSNVVAVLTAYLDTTSTDNTNPGSISVSK